LLEQPKCSLKVIDLPLFLGKTVMIAAYLVTVKDTRTVKGERMQFGTFVDQTGHYLDTVHFPAVVQKWPFRGRGVYAIWGQVMEEFDCFLVNVERMEKLAIVQDPRYADGKPHKQLA
jgi:DNA polymerase-3 subunit alpha